MSNRMQKIVEIFAQRAGIIGQSETTVAPTIERFAELIVQECVEQILTGVRTNPPQAEPPELVQTLVRRIEQHFGVAE